MAEITDMSTGDLKQCLMEENIYSEIKTITLEKFKVARYVVISPYPVSYMDNWAGRNGLPDFTTHIKKRIGWDFHLL